MSTAIVIFGASGDLTARKLIPALYNNFKKKRLPDRGMTTKPVDMEFHYGDSFNGHAIPEAYERLILDALRGDASLFARSDEIELAWKVIDGVRAGWEGEEAPPLEKYEPGSWGPAGGERLLGREGRWWVHDCGGHEEQTAQ